MFSGSSKPTFTKVNFVKSGVRTPQNIRQRCIFSGFSTDETWFFAILAKPHFLAQAEKTRFRACSFRRPPKLRSIVRGFLALFQPRPKTGLKSISPKTPLLYTEVLGCIFDPFHQTPLKTFKIMKNRDFPGFLGFLAKKAILARFFVILMTAKVQKMKNLPPS